MKETGATKDRVIFEALRLFADKGYEGTTLNDIADAVGIKAASLFSHFKGKDAIFREVLEKALADWFAVVAGIFADAEAIGGLKEGAIAVLSRFAGAIAGSVSYRFWARIYIYPPPPIGKEDLERFAVLDRELSSRLAEYCAKRVPKGTSQRRLETFCSTLSNLTMGLMVNGSVTDEAWMAGEIKKSVAFLLDALSVGGR